MAPYVLHQGWSCGNGRFIPDGGLPMKIAVVGARAMGSVYAGLLGDAGHETGLA